MRHGFVAELALLYLKHENCPDSYTHTNVWAQKGNCRRNLYSATAPYVRTCFRKTRYIECWLLYAITYFFSSKLISFFFFQIATPSIPTLRYSYISGVQINCKKLSSGCRCSCFCSKQNTTWYNIKLEGTTGEIELFGKKGAPTGVFETTLNKLLFTKRITYPNQSF